MNSAFYRSPGIYNPAFEVTDLDYDYLVATPHGDDGYYDPIGPSAHPGGRGGRFSSPPSRNHQPSGLGDYPGIVEPTYFPSPTGPYRGSAYDAPIDPMAYTEYACPPGDVVNPYKGHRYEPPGPKTHTDALARAGNMTTRNRDYDFEREVERQRAEEMERAGAVIQGPMADVEEHVQRRKASPGDLDEMRARVEAEDAGFYREPVDGAAWAFPQEPYSDREPDDGRPWAFPQPPCSDVES